MKNAEDMSDEELEQAEIAREQEQSGTSDATTSEEGTEGTQAGTTGEAVQTTTEGTEQTSTTEQTGQAGETTTTDTTGTTAAAETTAGAETGKVAGVASKDGTRVLPYSALQAERRSARQASARAERAEKETERLKQEIEDLRAGKSKDSDKLTEEEVQRMEADYPEEGKKLRAAFERTKELERQVAEHKPKDATEEEIGDDPVQEIIDQVPLLVEWQHDPKHADKWQRAIEIDNVMRTSPKWKEKPALDRFEHVTAMVAEEFDIEVPGKSAGTGKASPEKTPAKPKPDPAKAAVDAAQRQTPSTLSDLKGGAVPDHGQVDLTKMPPQRMLGRFMDMDDAEIDRQLAKLG